MSYTRFMDRSLDEMAADMRHPRDDDTDDRTLFVANLNYATSWQELRDHLRKAGPIERCDIFKDSNGFSKGFGLVVFGDVESAERALHEYNDSILNSRNMKLRKARTSGHSRDSRDKEYPGDSSSRRGKPKQDPACTVFVHNLDYSVTWQKLKDVFKVVGRVIDVEVLEGRKGAAVVQFGNSDDAIKAIALFHGQMLMDRPMQLRMDSKAPYQPDPLKLRLSTLKGDSHSRHESHTRHESHGHHEGHTRYEGHTRHESHSHQDHRPKEHPSRHYSRHEHHSRPRTRSRSLSPYQSREKDYSPEYSPPPRYGNGYGRETSKREESYYPRDSGRGESHYTRQEKSYPEQSRGYEKSERRYSGRSRSRSRSREGGRSFTPDWKDQDQRYITSVFVKNLPFSTTWQILKDDFRKAGLVKRAEIKMNKENRPSGLALVFYDSHKDACNAVSMFDNTDFDGRRINVQLNVMHPRPQRY